jgi:cell division protein FtsZ
MGEMGKAMMGTGEGEGENRALEAAERAIANPLLDGVSMAGAKGVIISIIGGEDMKLLEVDEAANHIRELVDPEANIIWGSAFNPVLEGKIRVSVVATGIEQSADQAHVASQPFGFATSRAPKKPVLPLPTEEELAEDAVSTAASAEVPDYGQPAGIEEEEGEEETAETFAPPSLSAYEPTEDEGEPEEEGLSEPADDEAYGPGKETGYASLAGTRIERDPEVAATGEELDEELGDEALELTFEAEAGAEEGESEEPGEDELLLDASRLAEADEPIQGGRRRQILGSGTDESEGEAPPRRSAPASPPTGGSTLFERMANLSRATPRRDEEEEEDEEDSSGSLRIPRFLGRQNNQ